MMIKKILVLTISAFLLVGCGKNALQDMPQDDISQEKTTFALEDGVYKVDFDTDSTMFHVNEYYEGKAKLVVENGDAMLYLVMPSKNVLNLYLGLAEDAQKEGVELITPSTVSITYADGYEDEVYAFEVPVTVYEENFDLALIGKKEIWYDHKVMISNAEPWSEPEIKSEDESQSLEDGTYQVPVLLEGGTGKASIQSPTKVEKNENGYVVTLIWSSKYYDYMIVDDIKYLPVECVDNSVFEIPVSDISKPINVIADTVAMSTPHEIEYTITFDCKEIQ